VFGNLGSSKLLSEELFADSRGIPITLASLIMDFLKS